MNSAAVLSRPVSTCRVSSRHQAARKPAQPQAACTPNLVSKRVAGLLHSGFSRTAMREARATTVTVRAADVSEPSEPETVAPGKTTPLANLGIKKDADELLTIANNAALPAWASLFVYPLAPEIISKLTLYTAIAYAVFYCSIIVNGIVGGKKEGDADEGEKKAVDFKSVEGLIALFSQPTAALGSWTHFIIYDLLVGRWVISDAYYNDIPHLLAAPLIVPLAIVGPAGFVPYVILRFVWLTFVLPA